MGVTETGKTILLNHDSGASVEIYLFGATVTSWKVGGKERLFVSSKSTLDETKPIRGGIPIVFPIFGPPPSSPPEYASLSQHGFARTQIWTLEKVVMDRKEGVSIRLIAPSPPESFPHSYRLNYVVTLTAHQLSTDIHLLNNGDKDFMFQALLHNYLAVPDSSKISISGLDSGTKYYDKAGGGKMAEWAGGPLRIDKEVDSVFHKVPLGQLELDDGAGSTLKIRLRGFEDCTIWNPQEATGSKMEDMEDGGWDRFVCIEPGYVREFKTLKAGEEFLGQQNMTLD